MIGRMRLPLELSANCVLSIRTRGNYGNGAWSSARKQREQSAHGSSRDLCGARVDGSGHRCRDTGFLSIREAKNTLGRRGCAPNEGDTHRRYPHPATACLTRSALLDAMIARHSQADAGRAAEHYNSPLGKLPVILSLSILCHRVLLFLWLNNPLPHPKIDGFQSA